MTTEFPTSTNGSTSTAETLAGLMAAEKIEAPEALRPQHELAHHQECPALTDHVQRARHAAAVAVGPHRRHAGSVVGMSNYLIGFSNQAIRGDRA